MAKTILVVEDDQNISELLRLYLEKEGYTVNIADDGGKGVELYRRLKPDLVLLDLMLPVLDGWGVLRAIRQDGKTWLGTAKDPVKDQTDFLAQIDYLQVSKLMFPIGGLMKQMGSVPKEEKADFGKKVNELKNWASEHFDELNAKLKEKEMEPEDIRFSPEHLSRLIALVDGKVINSSVAKEVFQVMFEEDVDPEQYVEEKGLKTVNDEGALRKVVEEVIAANPQSVEDYHNGKEKAIGFLVGQTMKAMKGKADPASVNQMLKELL